MTGMNIKSWLEAEKGRAMALSRHFGLTPSAVSQWKTNGVPRRLMRDVLSYTGGIVSLNDMVPHGDSYVIQRITAA